MPRYVWPRIKSEVQWARAALQRPAAFRAATRIAFPPRTVAFRWSNPVWHYEKFRPWYQLRNLDERVQFPRDVRCVSGLAYQRPTPLGPDWKAYAANVFVNGRRAGGGAEKLVVVQFDWGLFQHGHPTPFRARVESWDGYFKPMRVTASVDAYGFQFVIPNAWPPTIYAGQLDPLDESHFTIDYETPSDSGTIDGWLQPDSTVKLRVRNCSQSIVSESQLEM